METLDYGGRQTRAGHLLDEIVVKEVRTPKPKEDDERPDLGPYAWNKNDFEVTKKLDPERHTANEAVIMAALNEKRCENIVRLRAFKSYSSTPTQIYRFYIEYCPYGTLDDLRLRYRALNRYLPELFLWHLFDSLARALVVFENISDVVIHDRPREWGQGKFIVHSDLKPDNCFLGYEQVQRTNRRTGGLLDGTYPTVKLGDFGGSRITSQKDVWNPFWFKYHGTEGYLGPEQTGYGKDWSEAARPNEPGDKIGAALNVWQMGKIMYDLFSLSRPDDYIQAATQDEDEYLHNHGTALPNFHKLPFRYDRLWQRSPYSKELHTLIDNCMKPAVKDRFTASRVQEHTSSFLWERARAAESMKEFSVRNRKLYYRGNEINSMPTSAMNCDLELVEEEYRYLVEAESNDPDDPLIEIPKARITTTRRGRISPVHQDPSLSSSGSHISFSTEPGPYESWAKRQKETPEERSMREARQQEEVQVLPDAELALAYGLADDPLLAHF